MKEYRIVKYWVGFFSHYAYRLEVKVEGRFLWQNYTRWDEIAGNHLTTYIPDSWSEFNVIEQIEGNPE